MLDVDVRNQDPEVFGSVVVMEVLSMEGGGRMGYFAYMLHRGCFSQVGRFCLIDEV